MERSTISGKDSGGKLLAQELLMDKFFVHAETRCFGSGVFRTPGTLLQAERSRMGFNLWISLIRAQAQVLFFHKAKADVIMQFLEDMFVFMCDGSPTGVPTYGYVYFYDLCKYLCVCHKAHLVARRGADFKRVTSDLSPPFRGRVLKYSGSSFGRWAKARFLSIIPENVSLWDSFFKAKASCNIIDSAVQLKSLISHSGKISTSTPCSDRLVDEAIECIRPLLEELAEKLGEQLSTEEFDKISNLSVPQMKACYENPIKFGGTLGHLVNELLPCHSVPAEPEGERLIGFYLECLCCEEKISKDNIDADPLYCCHVCGMSVLDTHNDKFGVESQYNWLQEWEPKNVNFAFHTAGVGTTNMDYSLRKAGLGSDAVTEPEIDSVVYHSKVTQDGANHEFKVDATVSHTELRAGFINNLFEAASPFINGQYDDKGNLGFPRIKCKVVGILEPLKVRIITKGEAIPYYISTIYQKALASIIKNYPCFRLLGRTVSPTDLYDIANNLPKWDTEGNFGWASSDFTGASDGSHQNINDAILKILVSKIDSRLANVVTACNAPHEVEYSTPSPIDYLHYLLDQGNITSETCYYMLRLFDPVTPSSIYQKYLKKHKLLIGEYKKLPKVVIQQQGTLMGSKTSFPLLSIYVLLAHVMNLRRLGDHRPLWSLMEGVLINGDDRLTISTSSTEKNFATTCIELGMSLSPGKSFWHETFANINSKNYIFDFAKNILRLNGVPYHVPFGWDKISSRSKTCPKFVPYLNISLVNDQRKVAKVAEEKIEGPRHIAVINPILESCYSNKQQIAVLAYYLERWSPALRKECIGRNLFVSHGLGGWGVVPPVSWVWHATLAQRKLAAVLFDSQPAGWLGLFPLPGKIADANPLVCEDPWVNFKPGQPTFNKPKRFTKHVMSKKRLVLPLHFCTVDRLYTKGAPPKAPTKIYRTVADRASSLARMDLTFVKNELEFIQTILDDPFLGQHLISCFVSGQHNRPVV